VALRTKTKSRRRPGLDRGRCVLHEFVVDADIGQSATDSAGGGAQRGTGERHQEDQTDQRTPEGAAHSACRGGVDHLI